MKRDEAAEACNYEFGSWIGNELNITQSPLVAYLRGATYKVENFVPNDSQISCALQAPIYIDASKSFDPDIVQGMVLNLQLYISSKNKIWKFWIIKN